jgi:hypothetical protein
LLAREGSGDEEMLEDLELYSKDKKLLKDVKQKSAMIKFTFLKNHSGFVWNALEQTKLKSGAPLKKIT